MSVRYLAWVSWGVHGKTTAQKRANLWSSWGLQDGLPAPVEGGTTWIRSLGLRLILRLGL